MLRLLLNRYQGGLTETALSTLTEEDRNRITDLPIDSQNAALILKQPENLVQNIHYSWLIPPLENMPKEKLSLLLSLLPESQSKKLSHFFNQPTMSLQLTNIARSYLVKKMYQELKLDHVIPLEYLPKTDMTAVAHLNKFVIVDLIDYLGLFDLAQEIHHIVDKKLLEKIYGCLSESKMQFLNICLTSKETLVSQKMQLENWDGDCTKLQKLLHHKGIVRLGYALSGENPNLIWHITHTLDTGRGKKLQKYCSKDPISGITNTLQKQVKNVLIFFKKVSQK